MQRKAKGYSGKQLGWVPIPAEQSDEKNNEGLTFQEWIAAAAKSDTWNINDYSAWKRGEDPTEHRA